MDEDHRRDGLDQIIDLTGRVCPEGHSLEEGAPFCPVCLTLVTSRKAFWSVNQGVGPI